MLLMTALFSSTVFGKSFRNSYLSFELPETWKCVLENTEWVCRAEATKESKEAIIILTAKEVGPTDTFDAYVSHLNTPQATTYKGAPSVTSKVVYPAKKSVINDQTWIDGLHQSSEVPNYFTRYLATIKDKIAVLFTCSVHKDFYTKYNSDFYKAVSSLRVIATKDILANPNAAGIRPSSEPIGSPIGMAMPQGLDSSGDAEAAPARGGKNTKNLMLGIALLIGALGVYIFLKSKKR